MKKTTEQLNSKKISQAQLFIQKNLNLDLHLQSVAREAGLSSTYFHRQFKKITGETPREYITRLRLERAYYDIRISNNSLLHISAQYGFNNPETFTRAFKKYFNDKPSQVNRAQPPLNSTGCEKVAHTAFKSGLLNNKVKDSVTITVLRDLTVAYIRHLGPYESVPLVSSKQSPWQQLLQDAHDQAWNQGNPICIGMPLDLPSITVPEKRRYDMCVVVNRCETHTGMDFKTIRGGYYLTHTHAGSYASLAASYEKLYTAAHKLPDFSISSQPMFELLIGVNAKNQHDHTWTELYLPLEKGSV
ncbi:GyrI-like domain-containing protein [Marinicella sp. W31]|uniref:AraC family transcriptional regulator n=1 Tax=Marinicella sp. W31 TaxID=3023713 RepID=UPI0037574DD3